MEHLYLGKDGKRYNSEEEALAADKIFDEEKAKLELAEKERKALISKEKKELSDAIKEADERVKSAEDEYQEVKKQAESILKDAREQAEKLLRESLTKLVDARESRMNAIADFNKRFGAYTVTYTGDEAFGEFRKFEKKIRDFMHDFWLF